MTITQACSDLGFEGSDSKVVLPDTALTEPTNEPTIKPYPPTEAADQKILLFNGQGISTSDWQSFQSILKSMNLETEAANSSQLEAMSIEDLKSFRSSLFLAEKHPLLVVVYLELPAFA